jgi:VWFA-related protein
VRRAAALIAVVVAAGAALLRAQADAPAATAQPQTFRTGTDIVIVDVSVREGGRAVPGLRAEDFVVTDNGVRQRVESVESAAVPIDLTMVVDVSGDQAGAWTPRVQVSKVKTEIDAEIGRVAAMLRPDDRVRVLAIDSHVQLLQPLQPASSRPHLGRLLADGKSSLFDTLAAALLQPVEPSRRHVVVARTKGIDTMSAIDARALRGVAERSDALFHVVLMETALDNEAALREFQRSLMGLPWPSRLFWIPLRQHLSGPAPHHALSLDGQEVAAAAEATGGALNKTVTFSEPTLTGTFKKTFEDFRSSYVLRYTPRDVPQRGWHAIDVKLPGLRGHTVRARKGYLVEDRAPAPPPSPKVPDVPRTLADLTTAYEQRAYRQMVTGLRAITDPGRLLRDFTEAGNPWPATPRREAAFALELAGAAVFSSNTTTRRSGQELIQRFSRLVRHPLEPDVFEQYWHFAALTLMEGVIQPSVTEGFVTRALERFPDEPRFLLSRAIVTDQRWATRGAGATLNAEGMPRHDHPEAVRQSYAAAMAHPETAVEAHIRYAWFLHRSGRNEEARVHLMEGATKPTSDEALRYLRHLFLGHVLWALDEHDKSVGSYRAALTILPAGQSARVALMNALLMRGDRDAAEALAEQIQTENATDRDPWWSYWQGHYRVHPLAMARLRELSR